MNDVRETNSRDGESAIRTRIRAIAADIFQVDVNSIELRMGPEDIERWDSLNHLRLITAFEDAFQLRLAMQQIQQLGKLEDLVVFAAQKAA